MPRQRPPRGSIVVGFCWDSSSLLMAAVVVLVRRWTASCRYLRPTV